MSFAQYQKNIANYTRLLVQNGVQVTLCTPPIYDEYGESETPAMGGGHASMVAYANFIRQFAAEHGFAVCDYNSFTGRAVHVEQQPVFTADRVHPTEHGYYLMAKCFLASQGLQIDEEAPIPAYLDEWRAAVRRLRIIYGAEHMVVRTENYHLPAEEKLALVRKKLADNVITNPAIREYAQQYLECKPRQTDLYPLIDQLYQQQLKINN